MSQPQVQPASSEPLWQEIPNLSSESKRNMLMIFILVPFLLPLFGPTLGTFGIWFWAITATLTGVTIFWLFCQPADGDFADGLRAFVFTATIGIVILSVFQFLASAAAAGKEPKFPPGTAGAILQVGFSILQFIGRAYALSGNPPADASLLGTAGATIVSTGLCEEIVKLIPVLRLLVANPSCPNSKMRSVLFVGALSGLGFGIVEGLVYSFGTYRHVDAPLSIYIMRFFGCAFGHSILSILSSAVMFVNRDHLHSISEGSKGLAQTSSRIDWYIQIVWLTLSAAIPHGLSNAFLTHQMAGLAGLTDAIVIYIAVWIDKAYADKADPVAEVCGTQFTNRPSKCDP